MSSWFKLLARWLIFKLAECKLVVVKHLLLRSRCGDQGLIKCESTVLDLELKQCKEVRCELSWDELARW